MNAEAMVGDASPDMQDRTERWARIPQTLSDRPQWCHTWPGDPDPQAHKAPRTAANAKASSTDPCTWTTFDIACQRAAEVGGDIGYLFRTDDPFACVDLDVKETTTPEQMQRFQSIVNSLASYSEYSRGGKGMHVWVRANIGAGCKRDGVEVYSQERFIICTGNVYRDGAIEDRQDMLANMVSQMRGAQATSTPYVDEPEREPDDAIIARASAAANAGKFGALWAGNQTGYATHSEADIALMGLLAFYSPNNAQVKRLFRMSELGKREKATKDDRYLDRTLRVLRGRDDTRRQIEHGREIADRLVANWIAKAQSQSKTKEKTGNELLNELRVDWTTGEDAEVPDIVVGLVADEDVTLLGGHGGIGKSFLALQIACAIATGEPVLNHGVQSGRVLYYSAEDGRKRLTRRLRKMAEQFSYDKDLLTRNLVVVDASELEPLYGEQMQNIGTDKPYFAKLLGPTANFTNLQKMVETVNPLLLVIDGASDTYDGNEIARREVRAFIKLLRRVHPTRKIGVLLMVHIDRASARGHISNDEGYAGSAAWHNSCRRRMYLQKKVERDDDGEEIGETILLRVMKNQDGQPEPDMELTRDPHGLWQCGIQFTGELAKAMEPAEDPASVIVRLIGEYYQRGQFISTSLAANATTGVHAILNGDPSYPRGLSRKKLANIVIQLESEQKLERETYKNGARKYVERWKVVPDVQYTPPRT